MKKLVFASFLALLLFPLQNVFATVGGPGYYSNIYYVPSKNKIQLLNIKEDGGSCHTLIEYSFDHPEAKFIDTICNDPNRNYDLWLEGHLEKLKNNGLALQEVDLESLNIKIQSELKSEDIFGKNRHDFFKVHYEDYGRESFKWGVDFFIDDVKKENFIVESCTLKDPAVNFSGYSHSDVNFIFIVVTSLSQCFESGYMDDTGFIMNGITIPKKAFLGEPRIGFERGDVVERDSIKPIKGKIYHQLNVNKEVFSYINTLGMQAYNDADYQSATPLFHMAYNSEYLLPLFNLAATYAKTEKIDYAFSRIEELLSYEKTREHYLAKIEKDSDFDELRDDPRYLAYFPDQNDFNLANQEHDEYNLDIIEKEELVDITEEKEMMTDSDSSKKKMVYLFISILVFVIGLLIGRHFKK